MNAILCKDEVPIYLLNQRPQFEAVFTTESIHGPRKRSTVVVALLTIVPKNPVGDCMLLIPGALGSAELQVCVLKGTTLFQGTQYRSHQTSLQLLPEYSGLLVSRNQQAIGAITLSLHIQSFSSVYLLSVGTRLKN